MSEHGEIVSWMAAAFACSCFAAPVECEAGQTVKTLPESIAEKTDNLNDKFWLYLPKRYGESKEKLPLIIYLHGSSRRGRDVERVKANGLPPVLDTQEDFDFIVASPQSLSKYGWQKSWRPDDLILLLDHLVSEYRIDPNRVYLTGLSMGGYGTWATIGKHGERFAAAAPICGGGDPAWAEAMGELPIWAFHGEADYVVPIKRSREMVDAVRKAGGNAKLTSYPNVGHDSFTQTYANPELYRWLLKHSRGKKEPDVAPLISHKGDLVFEDDFDLEEIKPEWVGLHGTQWKVVDGALRGEPSSEAYQQKEIERGNKRHSGRSPSSRLKVAVDDCVMLFRFKISEKLSGAHFGFDDVKTGTQHVGRFIVTQNEGIAIQKDKNAKLKGDKNEVLVTEDFNLKPETWYWMMVEVIGDVMVAQVSGGPVIKARHPRFGLHKGQINLPARGFGGAVYYDDVRVWKATAAR